jgi:hypothetical protein
LAETLAGIDAAMHTIVNEDNGELLPGESRDELRAAWPHSDQKFRDLAKLLSMPLYPPIPNQPRVPVPEGLSQLTFEDLQSHGLTGPEGKAKRKGVWRAIDAFFAVFHSQPRTDEKRKQSLESAKGLAKICGTLVGSVPIIGEPSKEIFELIQQAIEGRMNRGY